jgi:hypothetical protein
MEAVVPNTFFQSVETIWSLVFKFAASTASDASVVEDIPASDKFSPIPTYCLLVSDSLPNTAPSILTVMPAFPSKSKAMEESEKEILSISERMSQTNNETNAQIKPNAEQPILLVSVREISEKEKDKLARIPDLRIFEVNKLCKNLNLSELREKFDLIILDAFDDVCFQMLRENYKKWQEDFNLTLLQRSGFSSDPNFSSYFENICKKLPTDAMNKDQFYKGINSNPYIKRAQKPWLVILKKIASWVFKL